MAVRGFETDIVENFSAGVITSILKDRLPDGASPNAKNSQFFDIGPERAIFGTRHGCVIQNATSVGDPIISQYFLNTPSSDVHLLVDGDGDLLKIVSGTVSTVTATLFTDVTSYQYSWQTAKNWAFVVNGTDAKKTNGTDSRAFGIAQPGSGVWSIASQAGGGALPTDTYDVAIAYYNSTLDHTGPASAIKTVSITNPNQIRVTLPNSGTIADAQVTHIKIFLRRQSTQSELYLVIAGTSPAISGTSGWAVNTSPVDLNPSAAEMAAFRILAPAVNTHYGPPTGAKFLANHRGRMFVATATDIYWSEVGDPESFNLIDDSLPVGEEDGEVITGMVEFKDVLVIFKQNAIYVLIGTDPATWSIELIDKTVGCTSYASIGTFDNKLFWMSQQGPQMWQGTASAVTDITTELIGPNFDEDHIAPENLVNSVIIGHPGQNWVGWAVTPVNQTRNTTIIPFNFKLNRWMASEWNMVDVRSATIALDSDGRPWPMIGDYDGTVYKAGVGDDDGVPASAISTGTPTSSTGTTVTDSTQTWTASSLIGRYVYIWNTANGLRVFQRRRITANTSTQLTVDTAWDQNPTVQDNYSIGGVFFDWRSGFRHGGGPFYRKRVEFLFLELATQAAGANTDVELYLDLNEDNPVMSRNVDIGSGDEWDEVDWDEGFFASFGSERKRIPIRRMGYTWQARVLQISNAGAHVFIHRHGVQWLTKTKKIGTGG